MFKIAIFLSFTILNGFITPAKIEPTCANLSNAYCINATAYQMCNSHCHIESTIKICPDNTVCTNDPNICVTPPTPTPPTTTTTPSPDQFCTQKGALGRFPIAGDTTCTQYAYCYVYNNNIVGQYGSCIGTTIFNPTLQLCVASDGYTCPT